MNCPFPEIKKNFGFGMMRLPMIGEDVDIPQTTAMVDAFMAAGFNYFDTARVYIQGKSELALKECLTSRYPRDSYVFTNKLSYGAFKTEEEILPLFESQLESCGLEYFDIYLHHCLTADRYEKYTECNAFEIVKALKAQGKIRHIGFSFHDTADVLDKILSEHPEIEVVQLQLNYVDWEDPNVQAHACHDVCAKYGLPVLVMEPVKGGRLVNLPEKADALMTDYSQAGYALRFTASQEQVIMVLSGMSDTAQMEDNLTTMVNFKPLTEAEYDMIDQVRTIYQGLHKIPCTGCRYCTDGCPAGIPIPDLFTVFNEKKAAKEEDKAKADEAYAAFEVNAAACLGCGQCENECPQHLHIRELLEAVHKAF